MQSSCVLFIVFHSLPPHIFPPPSQSPSSISHCPPSGKSLQQSVRGQPVPSSLPILHPHLKFRRKRVRVELAIGYSVSSVPLHAYTTFCLFTVLALPIHPMYIQPLFQANILTYAPHLIFVYNRSSMSSPKGSHKLP
ncbi:hypothetical protein GSI_05382 [Ganoderma sinense ZZ0214-1]|uniref:Uncharacterized protein n=1 Tax=Ganoderma sinense ZZ0214-1 TaxID=1077348 RepID=A0A2G8SGH2_9APHY|nr:hypothetical protein GSI_05382 [Ganoderma sinense ZZ0214-1]